MEEQIDFSNVSVDDFKVVGKDDIPAPEQSVEASAETKVESEPQVETKTEAPVETQVETKAETKVETKAPAAEYNWKDDFIKQAVEYYEKTGDLTPYLQAKTVDFNKMTDEEILRRSLKEQYSDLSDKAFDRLYKQQVVDKYKLDADEWGEDDSELGKELLRSEAAKLRGQYMDWQKNFTAPEPEEQPVDDSVAQMVARFEQEVRNNDFTKGLLDAKRISIKTTDGEFNYEIPEANTLVDMTLNNDKFFSQFANENGALDYAKWYKTAAYSQNPELFEKALINYGKTLGRSEITKEIKNPSNAQVADVPTESSGDFMSGLLQAFASRGIHK